MNRGAGRSRKYRDLPRTVSPAKVRFLTDAEVAEWFERIEQVCKRKRMNSSATKKS